jgi:predicted MFS family arabinose efflux permease
MVLAGILLWGAGMGAQESVMRAALVRIGSPERRGAAYGVFNGVYGIAWFLGCALMGVLYDHQRTLLVVFSVGAQLAAIPFFLAAGRRQPRAQ